MTPVWGLFLFVPESKGRGSELSEVSEGVGAIGVDRSDRSGSERIGVIGGVGAIGEDQSYLNDRSCRDYRRCQMDDYPAVGAYG